MKTCNFRHSMPSGSRCSLLQRNLISITASLMVSVLAVLFSPLAQADVNVLIIGSTQGSDFGFLGARTPFDPTQIKTELEKILGGAGLGTVNVTLENRANVYVSANRLASWYYYPYPADAELPRWSNLRGQNGTPWDYVVLIEDPSTIEAVPGAFCQGVSQIAEEVAKGTAKTVLLMNWPGAITTSNVAHYKEVVYRTANTTGCIVAPAALAWQAAGSPTGATHPTSDGAYIAASTLYSTLWGQSAAASTYTYNDTLANTAHTTVTNNIGVQQYTGVYNPSGRSQFFNDKRRGWGVDCNWAKSTDFMTAASLTSLISENRMTAVTESRSYPKAVFLSAKRGDGSAYPMDCEFIGMGNDNSTPIDQALSGVSSEISFCASQAGDPVNSRTAPNYMIWAGYSKLYPSEMPVQGQHTSNDARMGVAAYTYTMFSGRCPLAPKPNPVNSTWIAKKLGYEAAWRMGHVQGRAPGFRTLPSSATRLKMAPGQTETMTVQFVLPLKSDVTVNVSVSNPNLATVSPSQLTFTPGNYTTDQQVVVTCLSNADASKLIQVNFNTVSTDEVCNGLNDSWDYDRNFSPVITKSPWVEVNPVPLPAKAWVNVSATDPESDALTYTWSKVSGPGTATFSPNAGTTSQRSEVDFSKPGTYVLKVEVSDGTSSTDGGEVTVQVLNAVPVANPQAVTAFQNTPQPITLAGTDASGDPLTYVVWDDPLHGALSGTGANLVYTPASGYLGSDSFTFLVNDGYGNSSPATVTITVNAPNTPPGVNAGPDQTVLLTGSTPWTPAMISCAAWYDAADTNTITVSSGTVSQWRDKSGNSLHLGQGTAGNQPVTGAMINGRNALDFTGDFMTTASNPFGASVNNAFVIAVHKIDTVTNGTLFSLTGSENAANRWQTHAPYAGTLYFDCGASAGTNRISASYGVSAGSVVLSSFYCSTTQNVQQVYKNGSLLISDASGHAVSTAGNLLVGGFASGYQDTTLGEFIIINGAVSAADRQKLEGYLAHKWGQTDSLPADHPYKSAAPARVSVVANLAGSATDAEGDPLTTTWSLINGPGNTEFGNTSSPVTTATFFQTGTYVLRLDAADSYGQVFDEVTVTVTDSSGNSAPTAANASISTVENIAKAVTLSASDAQSGVLTYSIVTPPAHGTLSGTASNRTYTPTAGYSGSDSFTFKVNDGVYDSNLATVSITVMPNLAPVIVVDSPTVNAPHLGPYGGVVLETTVTDDGYPLNPGAVTLTWSWVVGSGTIESPNKADTTVIGDGVIRLTASDGVKQTTRDITLQYGSYPTDGSNQGPQVSAQPNVIGQPGIPVPLVESAMFLGDDGRPFGTLTSMWQILSGPGAGAFADPTVKETTFVCNAPGTYVLRLIADDGQIKAYDDLTITISGTGNAMPVPGAQSVAVIEDTPKVITLSGSDGNSNPLTYAIVTPPAHGTLSGTAPNVTYTPAADYTGSDSFTFKVNDGITDSISTATVSITVTPVNDAPVANAMSVTTNEDMRLPIRLAGSDADGDALTFSIVSQPAHGTMSGSGPGVKYTPAPAFNGNDAFTFRVTDSTGLFAEAVVSIVVTAVQNVPVANPQLVSAEESKPKLIVLTGTDADNDSLTYSIFAQPLHGTLDISNLPNVTYTSNANYFGADFFTFTVNDGKDASIVATVSIKVQPVGLSSVDTIRGLSEDQVANPHGYFANTNSDIVGASGIVYKRTVQDVVHGHGLPIIPPGAVVTGATLKYEVTGSNDIGSRKLHTYLLDTVNPDSSGTSFFYNGGENTTATAKYINSVTGIGAKQIALDRKSVEILRSYYGGDHIPDRYEAFFRFNLDTATYANTQVRYLVGNSPTQNTLELQYIENPEYYSVTFNGNGNTDGTAPASQVKIQTIPMELSVNSGALVKTGYKYMGWNTAADGSGTSYAVGALYTADANLDLYAKWRTNQTPVANAQSVTATEDTAKAIALTGSDADADALTYTIVTPPAYGTLSGTAPNVTYTPAANYNGSDSFTFKVNDVTVDSAVATVSITVNAVNDAPVANAQSVTTAEDTAKAIALAASDVDDDPLTYTIVTPPAHGTLSGTAPDVTYTPAANYSGSDSFTFKVNDGLVDSGTATVSITVTPVNDTLPVVDAGANQAVIGSPETFWTPAQISCEAWFDAADDAKVLRSGSAVTNWLDKSGNGRNATQGTAANQPAYVTGSLNGLPTIDFDGANDTLSIGGTAFPVRNCFVVANWEAAGLTTAYLLNQSALLFNGNGDSNIKSYLPSAAMYIDGTYKGAGVADFRTFANFKLTEVIASSNSTSFNTWKIGGDAGWYWNGKVAEVIMTSGALSDSDRQKIEGYLAHKWGFQASLPANHPYKIAAPVLPTAVANLTGTASDADGDPLTIAWSVVSPTNSGTEFGNATMANTTATFYNNPCTYVLRMTVDDGFGPVSDDVEITVSSGTSTPIVNWSTASQTSTNESGILTVTAQLSATSASNVTVPFTVTGTATAGDYTITASPLTIAAGATTGTATITITGDILDEPNETVILTMGTPTNAVLGTTQVHTATITDDDVAATPTVTWTAASQASTTESGTMTVTAQLSAASGQNVTLPFTVTGTANATSDYTITASPITIAAGATTGTATITITTDTLTEPNETVILTMGTPTNATLGTTQVHTATITDDDVTPTVAWTAASQASTNESGTMTVTAQLSAASAQAVTVPFTVTGTATGTDYSISASPINIAAGATTGTATITITADTFDESNETVILTMGTPTNAAVGVTTVHTATITDDDINVAPVVSAGPDQVVALSAPTPWTPSTISTTAWFDASDATSITASSGAVSQWADKSGNNRHVTQSTSTAKPAYVANTINGLPVLRFDGGDSLTKTLSTLSFSGIQCAFVAKQTSGGGTYSGVAKFSGPTDQFNIRESNASPNLQVEFNTGAGSAYSTCGTSYTYGSPFMGGLSYNGSNVIVYANGVAGNAADTSGTMDITLMNVGGQGGFVGDIGEMVFVHSNDPGIREKLEGYLAHKWGLAASLPADHPYKSAAPGAATATANLDGTVSDAEGNPLTTTWIQVSGPVSTIASPSAVDTTATFTQAGTYTFRLTANDGSGPVSDDVVITVNPASTYDIWMAAANLGGGVDATFNGDANGDGMANGLGWLLGAMNPNENGNLLMPQAANSGGNLSLSFKMPNSTKRGAAVLSLQYSNDLGVSDPWTNHTIPVPDVTDTSGVVDFEITPIPGTDHNRVQVTIPASEAGGTGKVFVRMHGVPQP